MNHRDLKIYSRHITPILIGFLGIIILSVTDQSKFSDNETYLVYMNQISTFGVYLDGLDIASNMLFLGAIKISNNLSQSLDIVRYSIFTIFLFFCWFSLVLEKIKWQRFALFLAVFGPLLATVTLRATPAYILVFMSFYSMTHGHFRRGLSLAVAACLFHVTALLALPMLLVAMCEKTFFRSKRIPTILYLTITMLYLLRLFDISLIVNSIYTLFEDSSVTKYEIYTTGYNHNEFGHFIYFNFCFIIVTLSRCFSKSIPRNGQIYILLSAILFFSGWEFPVAMFRQSIFWMPMLFFYIPLERFLKFPFGQFAYITAVSVVGVLSIENILVSG